MTDKVADIRTAHRVPYDDNYETCERTLAVFQIYSDCLVPDKITELLAVEPTSGQEKGRRYTNSIGRQRTGKMNAWFLSSEGKTSSLDLRRHLDWLLDKLEPSATKIRELQRMHAVRMSINCIWWSAHATGGPTLWPEQMRRIADLNLECCFDISFYGDEEE
jgi:hypothetical protein